ncbi:MAG: hypothetical protein JRJ82_11070, partial [Deltaproteobacteria bacterium]|nr:hypothetical protein [Deltaproteobacteria bacterium]
IMVDTETKGYEANKLTNKLGIRASDTAELAFKDVRVPVANLIGKEEIGGRAWRHITPKTSY